jgi:hypothetical protein
MFRVIGGIVVYGFALYGVVALVSRLKAKKANRPASSDPERSPGESANEAPLKPAGRISDVRVNA